MAEDYNTLDAIDEDTLTPYTYIGKSKVKSSGKMINNTSTNATLLCGESFTVPKGYHDGTGIIKAASLAIQTADGNVTPDEMLNGKMAWANGVMVTGNLPMVNSEYEINASSLRFSGGVLYLLINQGAYLNASNGVFMTPSSLASALSVKATQIAVGKSILGVSGTFDSSGTVEASDVIEGKTIYSKGKKIVGTLQLNSLF